MRIICAPDSFKESLSASAAAAAMATGIRRALPDASVDCCPVGDGGEGTAAALIAAAQGESRRERVMGPLGDPVDALWGLLNNGRLAVVEMAAAAGLTLIPAARRDPSRTTTYGVGQLIAAACRSGAGRLIVCVGGSATNDGGCGMAQALGIRFEQANGTTINEPITGAMLTDIARIDPSDRLALLDRITVTVASDVFIPLTGTHGAARMFAAQKGASVEQIEQLEAGLEHLARRLERDLGLDIAALPGSGAAGGLGAGLMAFASATMASGIELVLDAVNFAGRVTGADVCLTGEGRLDSQSLEGKACLGVARAAAARGVPTIALVGAMEPGAEAALSGGLTDAIVIGKGLTIPESMDRAPELIAAAAAQAVMRYADRGT